MHDMLLRGPVLGALAALFMAVACGGGESGVGVAADEAAPNELAAGGESNIESTVAAALDEIVLETGAGSLQGLTSGSVDRFLGIRYATADRFAAPALQPLGAGPATAFGSSCPQVNGGVFKGDEDCLFANVYRPAQLDPAERLPVLFWIHGGSFTTGAGSDYDPSRLVETNRIIVVTINYRLGPLGFLAVRAASEGAASLSGEYGLLDQREALRWVQANIATFGGDPARVTVAGESAGGASVCAQLTSPGSSGLFSQAIIQSASCVALTLAAAEAYGASMTSGVGCPDASAAIDCARGKTAAELTSVASTYAVVAGGALLPSSPTEVLAVGVPGQVPVMVGSLRDEIAFFAAYFPAYFELAPENYPTALQNIFPAAAFPGVNTAEVSTLYPVAEQPSPKPFFAISAVASDSGYFYGSPAFIYWQALGGCVTSRLAATLSRSTATFAYELDDPEFVWNTATTGSPLARGASHTSDLPFLFELSAPLNQPFGVAQNALADTMVGAWGAFVNSGDPSTSTLAWPGYTQAAPSTMHLEPGKVGLSTDVDARHHCEFWTTALALPPT